MAKPPLRNACAALAGAIALAAAPCAGVAGQAGGAPEPRAAAVRIAGSSTMCPMIAAVAERFRAARPDARVEVECGGSERGIRGVREGTIDIGLVARALTADERDLAGFTMARDGVSIIVNRENAVGSLSPAQVAAVFGGKVASWRELGGKDVPVAVVLREADRPVTELFARHFGLEGGLLRGRVVPGDNPVTVAAVAADPAAIGYVSSGEAERSIAAGAAIRLVPLDGVLPTERNVIRGNYPVTRPLSLVTRGLPAGPAKEFVDYCLSPKAVDLIEKFDFAPYED